MSGTKKTIKVDGVVDVIVADRRVGIGNAGQPAGGVAAVGAGMGWVFSGDAAKRIELPRPAHTGGRGIEIALHNRRESGGVGYLWLRIRIAKQLLDAARKLTKLKRQP